MAHAAFFGVGAYVSMVVVLSLGWPYLVGLGAAVVVAAAVSGLLAFPALRVSGDYLVIASLGFQVIIFNVFMNWESITGGPAGVSRIPRPGFLGWTVESPLAYGLLSCVMAVGAYLFVRRIVSSPFGRVLRAIREDEVVTQALGKNVTGVKVVVFMVSGGVAATAGSLFAHYTTYINPYFFTLEESILILSVVIVGGAGNLTGSVLGAVVLTLLPQALRLVELPEALAANLRQIIYAALLAGFMFFRPQGILAERTLTLAGKD
ncbi:MAG: branched-chain amino acid ABC transporter permease [Candidatus Rokubacteria bacterium GWF2_70_14]|nr:MAG: branched-chain amino acid ABC transporter permease [Candidatus Rokubacteria bacterium GWA2_70_23]OGK89353.1 MAG: branched-chain amino acid ABC transporter permease [Candidatus Rokubacteria bacterium GWF2_70_14]